MTQQPLTLLSSKGGCAAKTPPNELFQLLNGLHITDPNARLNIQNYEDAGLFHIDDDILIVQSLDVITPVSDDPFTFGGVAAAHALSDLYAKGAKPLTGLLFLGLPALQLSIHSANEILQGAIFKLEEAGAVPLGGHTINSQELQLGLAVTGKVENEFIPNIGCREGDALILTKPLGSGIIITALKLCNAGEPIGKFSKALVKNSEKVMLELNVSASEGMIKVGVHACTDLTGFGLIGHLCEMLRPSGLSANLRFEFIPILEGVLDLASQDIASANCEQMLAYWWEDCKFSKKLNHAQKLIVFDPQTSGGLLISVARNKADDLLNELNKAGVKDCAIIGEVVKRDRTSIWVDS